MQSGKSQDKHCKINEFLVYLSNTCMCVCVHYVRSYSLIHIHNIVMCVCTYYIYNTTLLYFSTPFLHSVHILSQLRWVKTFSLTLFKIYIHICTYKIFHLYLCNINKLNNVLHLFLFFSFFFSSFAKQLSMLNSLSSILFNLVKTYYI